MLLLCIGSSLFTTCAVISSYFVCGNCVWWFRFPSFPSSSCDPRSPCPPRPPLTGVGRRIRSRGFLLYMPLLFLTVSLSHSVPPFPFLRSVRPSVLFLSSPSFPFHLPSLPSLPRLSRPSSSLLPPSFPLPSIIPPPWITPLLSSPTPLRRLLSRLLSRLISDSSPVSSPSCNAGLLRRDPTVLHARSDELQKKKSSVKVTV